MALPIRQARPKCYAQIELLEGDLTDCELVAHASPYSAVIPLFITAAQPLNSLLATKGRAGPAPPRAGDIRESLADISAARKLLGYEPRVAFDDGLRRSIGYYRATTQMLR